MARPSGAVPAETSVCLTPGTATGRVTAGTAVTRLDVSTGSPQCRRGGGEEVIVFQATSRTLPLVAHSGSEKPAHKQTLQNQKSVLFPKWRHLDCTQGEYAEGGMFGGQITIRK